MANLTCIPTGGIVHYTTGAAGSNLDNASACCYASSYIERTILGEFGYSVVHAPNASSLRLAFYYNRNGSLGDEAWLYK